MGDAESNDFVPFQINYVYEFNEDKNYTDPLNPPTKFCHEAYNVCTNINYLNIYCFNYSMILY